MAQKVTAMHIKMLVATLPDDVNVSEWCRRLGISRPTAYKWRARYREGGLAALEDRSRAPKTPAGRTAVDVEEAVVAARKELAEEGFDCGPVSVWCRLAGQGVSPPSEATIWRVLVRRGLISPQPHKRPRKVWRRFQRAFPNECWQGDDTHYVLVTGQEVRIINLLDDCSRLCVDSLAGVQCRSVRIWECFCRATSRYGIPAEFLSDNGRNYLSPEGEQPCVFQANLAALGVRQLHSSPYHPQTCGKVERFHQTQRRWLDAQPQARTVAELQALLDEFRVLYNAQRPHRALRRRTPAEVWTSLPRAHPAATATNDHSQISPKRVGADGLVSLGRAHRVGLGAAWTGTDVTVIRCGDHATIVATHTGEIIRQLTLEPGRRHHGPQPGRSGRPPNPHPTV